MTDNKLTAFLAFEIRGESYTFPLPRFHRTFIAGWGGDEDGIFRQEQVPVEEVSRCLDAWDKYTRNDALIRRVPNWIRRLRVIPRSETDEEGITSRWRESIGEWLHRGNRRPSDPTSHTIRNNRGSNWTLVGTHGAMMIGNQTSLVPDPTGVTDSTAAIQDLFTINQGGVVALPLGNFKITETLKVRDE